MKIAAVQMVSGTSVQANLDVAAALLSEAATRGAELAVLPEYFCLMGRKDTDKLNIQEAHGQGLIQDFLSHHARQLGLWLVGGTLPLATADAGRARNSTLVYDDKIHLFRYGNGTESYDETLALEPGSQAVAFKLASLDGHDYRIGLSICYDLRFPELYRSLQADIVLVPSAFTFTTGQAHWEVLLRARAIENLCYVVAAAQGGVHDNGRRTWGHSMMVDPWGKILACQDEGAGLVMSEVSKDHIDSTRAQLPALDHAVLLPARP
jgi:predicted amidohydrolase